MMMKMLEAGGMPVVTDGKRQADEDNPNGYYELEKTISKDFSWVDECEGKAVKVMTQHLQKLPSTKKYRAIFMRRSLDEIIVSQKKMVTRLGKPEFVNDTLKTIYIKHLRQIEDWLSRQCNFRVMNVDYKNLAMGEADIFLIAKFMGGLDSWQMAEVIDPSLYRNRL